MLTISSGDRLAGEFRMRRPGRQSINASASSENFDEPRGELLAVTESRGRPIVYSVHDVRVSRNHAIIRSLPTRDCTFDRQ
ncbi:unnamed protein product [Sphagnum balticum]